MLFQIHSPKQSSELLSQFVSQKLGLVGQFDLSFLTSVIWFCLFATVVRYFQTVVLIERQYKYLHIMEKEISSNYHNKMFIREGKAYLRNYPLFSEWTSFIYTIIFPVLLVIILVIKVVTEIPDIRYISLFPVIDLVIFLCISASTILYMLSVHFDK